MCIRDRVNKIQNIRKESGFELTDRVSLILTQNAELQPSLIEFKDYICREILADSLEFVKETEGISIDVNGFTLTVNLTKN